jgi:hypothetical protein
VETLNEVVGLRMKGCGGYNVWGRILRGLNIMGRIVPLPKIWFRHGSGDPWVRSLTVVNTSQASARMTWIQQTHEARFLVVSNVCRKPGPELTCGRAGTGGCIWMHFLSVCLAHFHWTDHRFVPVLPNLFKLKYGQNP